MEKTTLTTAALALNAIEVQLQKSDVISGVLLHCVKDAEIKINKEYGTSYGKLIWAKNLYDSDKNAIRKDHRNANEQLRSGDLRKTIVWTGA